MFHNISQVKLGEFLKYSSVNWKINTDNNICFLVGSQGSGKLTLMRNMMLACSSPETAKDEFGIELSYHDGSSPKKVPITFIDTLNIIPDTKVSYIESEIDELDNNIKDSKNYEHYVLIQEVLNDLLCVEEKENGVVKTGACIRIVFNENGIKIIDNNSGKELGVEALSGGHSKMFYMMLRSANAHYKKSIVFIDKPENSLELNIQRKIYESFKKIAPHNQFIVKTHSPMIITPAYHDECVYDMGEIGTV